jgi:hypothetical protein
VAEGSTEQQLAWEARQRPRAAAAAIVAGVLTFGADIYSGAVFRDAPTSGFLESAGHAQRPGPLGGQPSLRTPFFQFYDAHRSALLGASVARALGLLAMGFALTFLAAAIRSRRIEMPRIATPLALIGAVLLAVSTVVGAFASAAAVSDYLSGPRTVDAARDVTSGSLLVTGQFIGLAGQLALATGFVFVSLNGMSAGLLTRFMGILGIIVGALIVIPIGPVQVVQPFWLLALGALFAGFWPSGMPPAWRTGRAEPWPSQREVAEQRRQQALARRAARRGEPPPDPEPEPQPEPEPEPVGAAAARRRKRKRRS